MTNLNQLFDNFEQARIDFQRGLQEALKSSGLIAPAETISVVDIETKTVEVRSGLSMVTKQAHTSPMYKLLIHGPMGDREVSFPRQAYEYFAESSEPNILKEPQP